MANIGALNVTIGADTSGLDRGLNRAQGGLRSMSSHAKTAAKAIAAVTVAATAAATAVFAFTKRGMDNIDAQAKLARQLDGTIGGLRSLRLAASDAGIETGTLNGAMERLSPRLGEAKLGTGQAAEALARLGLRAGELAGMDVDQRIAVIADRVAELGLSGDETANVLRDLGIRNTEMVNLLRQGGDAIRDARQEVEDYGLAINAVDASTIEAANDAFSRVALVIESVQSTLAVELAPIILEIADRFNTAAREAGGWGEVVSSAIEHAIRLTGQFADIWHEARLAIKQGDVAVAALEVAMAEFARKAWESVSPLFDNMIAGFNKLIEVANNMGASFQPVAEFGSGAFMDGVIQNADVARGRFNLLQMELNDLAGAELPSDQIDKFFDAVDQRREELRKKIEDDGGLIPSVGGGFGGRGAAGGGETGGSGEGAKDGEDAGRFMGGIGIFGEQESQAFIERLRDMLEMRQEILREYDVLDEERQQEAFEREMERLREALELKAITEQEYRDAQLEAEREYWSKRYGITQNSESGITALVESFNDKRVSSYATAFDSILNSLSEHSKAAFNIQKGLAIASATIDAYKAITGAYKVGASIGGPPLGAAFAAAAGAAQFATIAKIVGTQFNGGQGSAGGGGSASAGGGGSAAAGGGQQAQEQQRENTIVTINIAEDGMFSGRQVRGLIESINDELDNGMRLRTN